MNNVRRIKTGFHNDVIRLYVYIDEVIKKPKMVLLSVVFSREHHLAKYSTPSLFVVHVL